MELRKLISRLPELPGRSISFYEANQLTRKSYPDVYADVETLCSHLRGAGVVPGMRVGLAAENCYEWVVLDLALINLRCVLVAFPLEEFARTTADELAERYALHLLLLSDNERKRRPEAREWITTLGAKNFGPVTPRRPSFMLDVEGGDVQPLDPDVYTLVFSSGTSGKMKCLLMSERGTAAVLEGWGSFQFKSDDAIFVVLPLSNFQQRLMIYTAIRYGFDVLLTDHLRLFQALKEMRPTLLAGPPLFYEVAENRFRSLPPHKRRLLSGVGKALRLLRPASLRGALQRRCFAPFHEAFGGRMRLMLSGSAPIRRSTLDLFALAGLPLYEVYALTEFGFVSWNLPGDCRPGSVGKPMFKDAVTIAGDGEIILHHKHLLSRGYLYGDAEEERKTFIGGDRIATGDIGRFDEDGYLYIVGRKKQIIITQGGYKIQPEALEKAIEQSDAVGRAVVFGGGELSTPVALVSLRADAEAQEARKSVRSLVAKLNADAPTPSRIGRVVFTDTQFRMDNGLLTRNLKLDRRAIYEKFRGELTGVEDS
jgi:long-subunit acyl-CoA synthetase (AMP-forming)